MTSIREVIQRMLFRLRDEKSIPAEFSNSVYWTKLVRGWSAERRHIVRVAVEGVVEQADFKPNEYRRLYHLPEIDDVAHTGASLLTLLKLLEALDESENVGRDE
jgi:hypothetical protein